MLVDLVEEWWPLLIKSVIVRKEILSNLNETVIVDGTYANNDE